MALITSVGVCLYATEKTENSNTNAWPHIYVLQVTPPPPPPSCARLNSRTRALCPARCATLMPCTLRHTHVVYVTRCVLTVQ